jgi:electron transfer flavoprotein alpha subunit
MKCKRSCLNNSVLGWLRNAEATAAVNNDAGPPIFKAARYGTAGDFL